MNCSKHVDRAFAKICVRCEAPICDECVEERNGKPFCAACADRVEHVSVPRPLPGENGAVDSDPGLYNPEQHGVHPGVESSDSDVSPESNEGTLARGIGFALGAGIVGALIWYGSVVITGYDLGIVAVGIGWLVGYAAVMGAGQGSFELSMISVAIAIVCMLSGEYLIASHFYREMFGDVVTGGLPIAVFFGDYLASAGLLAMVFWGIGAYEAYKVPSEH